MVGATLGLLAFMLAFTFGMAGDRFPAPSGLCCIWLRSSRMQQWGTTVEWLEQTEVL
jgi:hypothetical protein